jgi:glycosyltransferase involved in cell wall biosynthesis
VVPVYNYATHLKKTLLSLKQQSITEFELIVVDDGSTDNSAEVAKNFTDKVIINTKNCGPAISRNRAIKLAKGKIIAFIDSDCIADKDWLKNILETLKDDEVEAVMGNTKIPKSNFIGDSISELGFPGGANAGFENMWHVDKNGFTDHLTSCNFAVRKIIFQKYGMFDESFPLAGGEDPELSYRWSNLGVKIKYSPKVIVLHEPRTSLISFSKWMIYRGRSNYYFKRKIGNINGFLRLRIWSSFNIIKKNILSIRIILLIPLLILSLIFQKIGYILESIKKKN